MAIVARIAIVVALLVLLAVPVALAPRDETLGADARSVIILTPHNEQIRSEFGAAFEAWHAARYGEPARVVWSTPGGTSEIRRMLEAAYAADLRRGGAVGGNADLLFGGGSYEFSRLSHEISVDTPEGRRTTTVLEPIAFGREYLDRIYGANEIGDARLYDPKGFWFGVALSGFGIVYNRDLLHDLGLPKPTRWADLCDPRLERWVALVNPSQSGSVATAYDAILQRRGWGEGWGILRRASANARTFAASAPRAPTDVSLGDAAMGICIDFYGRYQAEAIDDSAADPADRNRVGYVDPAGETVIDPDPIAMLRGAPHPQLAQRFIEFTLSDEGQALWQLPARHGTPGLGPETYELRRLPIRRELYRTLGDRFVDRVDPFSIATKVANPNPAYRDLMTSLFVAMAIDNTELLRDAWDAIVTHPAYPNETPARGFVTAADVTDPTLKTMLELFDSLPTVPGPDGAEYALADPSAVAPVREGWIRGGWSDARLWPSDARPGEALRSRFGEYFRSTFRRILEISRGARA